MKVTLILCALFLMPTMSLAETFSFETTFGTIGTGTFVYDDAVKGFDGFHLDFSSLGASYANLGLNSGIPRYGEDSYGNLEQHFGPWGDEAPGLYHLLTDSQTAGAAYMAFAPGLMLVINGANSPVWTSVNNQDMCATPGAPAGGYAFCTPTASGLGTYTAGPWSAPAAVPEPSTWLLMGTGLVAIAYRRLHRKN
jgi:hypothetical protein